MESDEKRKEEIVRAATGMEFYPVEMTDKKELRKYKKIPLTEVSGIGAMFSELVPKFRTVTSKSTVNTGGLYRCSFPEGVSGNLARFKDGSGYTGTIMNGKIVGQARWNPVDSVSKVNSVTIPINPVDLFMAAAILELNKKIDRVEKLGREILNYLKEKDRFEMEANYDALLNIYNKFKFNLQDETWRQSQYGDVLQIKRNTAAKIKHLRSQIENTMDKHDWFHSNRQTEQMVRSVQNDFQLYQMAVFMFSFSTFLEVLLQRNFSEEYLQAICDDMNEKAFEYKKFYTKCYNKLEHSSKTTVESKFLKGLAKVSSDAGKTIHKIPVIEKGPVDEALMDAGKSVKNMGEKKTRATLQDFAGNMDSGTRRFIEGIEAIDRLYNKPMDVLLDKDDIYLKLDAK